MKINEIARITNLSTKTIRFYEEKGLLKTQRTTSGYREYNNEHVDILMKIKLFRRCGLSIGEIIDVQNDENILNDLLYQKIEEFDKNRVDNEFSKELCKDIIEAKGDYTLLFESVDFLETDDYKKFVDNMVETDKPSLPKQIALSLILLAPLLWCFVYLDMKKYNMLPYSIITTFIATIILTWSWIDFIKRYKYYNETPVQGLKKTVIVFIAMIVGIVLIIGMLVGLGMLQYTAFLKHDVFMISVSWLSLFVFLGIGLELFTILLSYLSRFFDISSFKDYDFVLPLIKKHKVKFLLFNIILIAVGFINVSTFTDDLIIQYSLLNPLGKTYTYKDVKSVETGFYKNGFLSLREKGDFYYNLEMIDGTKIKIQNTQTISQYEEDSYLEYVILDKLVMEHKPDKIGNTDYSEYLLMDDIYIQRFKDIVNNK